ncbi:hypothetical protein, partial [Streptomyces albidoflavus]|uniref:hypothetical protein n=1 Tax=Streptomyces albidoflavus TaxID=1886 RepID=UPI00197DD11F
LRFVPWPGLGGIQLPRPGAAAETVPQFPAGIRHGRSGGGGKPPAFPQFPHTFPVVTDIDGDETGRDTDSCSAKDVAV